MDSLTEYLVTLPIGAQMVLMLVVGMTLLRMLDGLFLKNRMVDAVSIYPRSRGHFLGILFAHWVHANRKHLFGDILPFLVMGSMIAMVDMAGFWVVTGFIVLVAGFGTWLFGAKGAKQSGCSALISGYFGFIMLNGLRTDNLESILWALGVSAVNFAIVRTAFGYYEGLSRAFYFFGLVAGLLSVFVWERVLAGV